MKLLFNNGDQHVSGDGAPDLRFHRILAVADETFDTQMLLDPLEEQLDLPAAFVQRGNRQCGQGCVVGQEHQRLAGFRVFEADAPQLFGIVLRDVETVEHDALIADDAGTSIDLHRVHPVRVHSSFGANYEERPRLMQREQATEIQITPIHHVESPCLEGQGIQHVDFVGLAIRDVDESRNIAAQIQQGMQSDRRLAGAKQCPWKQRQAQVYGRRIQCVDRIGQIDTEAVVAIQFACTPDQQCSQVFPDVPVACFVGVGQCRTFDWRAETHAVQLRLVGQQAGFDISQTLAVGQLRKSHGAELLGTTQIAHARIATMTSHDSREARPWHKLHELCEQRFSKVHRSPPEGSTSGDYSNLNL